MAAVDEATKAGARLSQACETAGLTARTLQRWRAGETEDKRGFNKPSPPNRFSAEENCTLMTALHSPEFRNLSPAQVVPRLADVGRYLGSEATMYRRLRASGELKRRDAMRQGVRRAPRAHVATRPNQVWCWDISYLPGPRRGFFYFLYLVVDLFSRRVMAAEVQPSESAELAGQFIQRACQTHGVDSQGLVLHSDNGGPMKGATMLETLRWLGIQPSFSRPYVSDDNAYVESLFRTAKYRPGFPREGFASLEAATLWAAQFVHWYNEEHRHSGIRFVTPLERYTERDVQLLQARAAVYAQAQQKHPSRWTTRTRNWSRPTEVRLNKPCLISNET